MFLSLHFEHAVPIQCVPRGTVAWHRTFAALAIAIAVAGTACPVEGADSSADAVMARALNAMGGAAVVDGVTTMVISAENTRYTPSGPVKVTTTTYFQFPLDVRHEMEIEGKRLALVSTIDGAVLVTPEGNVDLSNRARLAIETPAMRNPLALLKARHARDVSFVRSSPKQEGTVDEDLLEMTVGPHLTTLAFDRATGRLVRQAYRAPPGDDIQGRITIVYTNFRQVSAGLVYPFESRALVEGRLESETRIKHLQLNGRLDPALFPSPERPREGTEQRQAGPGR